MVVFSSGHNPTKNPFRRARLGFGVGMQAAVEEYDVEMNDENEATLAAAKADLHSAGRRGAESLPSLGNG